MLSRLENDILGTPEGLKALDEAILRAADALIKKKWKYRFVLDVDSTNDPTHGKQEGSEYNGHFKSECFHPIFAFTGEGDALAGVLRPGKIHSADGTEEVKHSVERLIRRIVKVAARIPFHSRYWWVHVASAFPLHHHYQAVFGHG